MAARYFLQPLNILQIKLLRHASPYDIRVYNEIYPPGGGVQELGLAWFQRGYNSSLKNLYPLLSRGHVTQAHTNSNPKQSTKVGSRVLSEREARYEALIQINGAFLMHANHICSNKMCEGCCLVHDSVSCKTHQKIVN